MTIETEVADLTTATNSLLAAVSLTKATLDSYAGIASTSASSASSDAASASASRALATASKDAAAAAETAAIAAKNTTIAVAAGGTASLTAVAARMPLSDGSGKLDDTWLSAFTETQQPSIAPSLNLDFRRSVFDSRITFTRNSVATYINSNGLITVAPANSPRIDYDPLTLACKGLLLEDAGTNLLLNSVIAGTNLATQSVTVTAVAHSLSFYGTGSVTLSGVSTGSLVGSGAYPTRSTLTFTPTAGSLTLTVTGTVQFAQLEIGSFPTSYIPTMTAAVTRAVESAQMTGANFSSWFNASEGAFCASATVPTGQNILTAGTASITSTGATKYATSYSSANAATSLVLGLGLFTNVSYYNRALTAEQTASLTA